MFPANAPVSMLQISSLDGSVAQKQHTLRSQQLALDEEERIFGRRKGRGEPRQMSVLCILACVLPLSRLPWVAQLGKVGGGGGGGGVCSVAAPHGL